MGFYINPSEGSKERWLAKHGVLLVSPPPGAPPEGEHYVVLVDNGAFTAAAIANEPGELADLTEFFKHGDVRPTQWWSVPDADLIAVCPQVEKALR